MQGFMLGKLAPRIDDRTLRLADYLSAATLPPPMSACDWTGAVSGYPMMQNDRIGDCTMAAAGHMIQTWSANASGHDTVIADADVVAAYSTVSGYDPRSGANDNGAVVLNVLRYWRRTGVGGHKISAFAAVKPASAAEVKYAIELLGGCYLGIALPQSAQQQTAAGGPWDTVGDGRTGASAPGSWGGHAVPALAYDEAGVTVATWGMPLKVTWRFFTRYVDEAYALISPDWFNENESPEGFDLAALTEDLRQLAVA